MVNRHDRSLLHLTMMTVARPNTRMSTEETIEETIG